MKNLLHFILMLVLVAALGVGCSRGGGEAGLVAIDSLIAASPDSALAALGRIDTASLGEGGRAYHALLTVQAHFLAGHPATDSTDICRAWRWYAHHGPAGRQLRAMRYRARTAEEMGDSVTAMRWYKRTELTAREQGDDEAAAYALMSMGLLYKENIEFRAAIDKLRQADSLFADSDPECAFFCEQNLAELYIDDDIAIDSAMHYLNRTLRHAERQGDSAAIALTLATQAEKWLYDSCYAQAKEAALRATAYGVYAPRVCWYHASESYAMLNRVDSAEHILNSAPAPATALDSVRLLHCRALISLKKGNPADAYQREEESDDMADEERDTRIGSQLAVAESEAQSEFSSRGFFDRHPGMRLWAVVLGLLAAGLVGWKAYKSRKRHKAAVDQLNWLNDLVQRIDAGSAHEVAASTGQYAVPADFSTMKSRVEAFVQDKANSDRCAKEAGERAEQAESQLNEKQRELNDKQRELEDKQRELDKEKAEAQALARSKAEADQRAGQAESEIKQRDRRIEEMDNDLEMVQALYTELSAVFSQAVVSLGKAAEDYSAHGNAERLIKAFKNQFDDNWKNAHLWEEIERFINRNHDNVMTRIREKHPGLTEQELRLLMLSIIGFSPNAISICLGYKGVDVVYVKRARLRKKLGDDHTLLDNIASSDKKKKKRPRKK